MTQSLLTTPSIWVHAPENIETIDFSTDVALLHNDAYDWYGGKLYTPEDFAAGVPETTESDARYGTNRLVLRLPTGRLYGISGTSASYAQRVWVNGKLLSEVGRVSDTPEGFSPKTAPYSVYFTADSPETEIVIQRAHHNHVRGYYVKLYLGDAQVIAQMDKDMFMREGLITGALVAIAIFFFGMFFFYSNRYSFLWFALACFCTALQNAIYSKSIMTIFPDLNWYLGHKIEYIALIAYFFFMFLYAFSMLEWKVNKWVYRLGLVFFIGSMAAYAILPSTLYTNYTKTMRELLTLYIVVGAIGLLVTVIRYKELHGPEHLLVVASMLLMAAAWWIEQQGYMGDMVIAVSLATLLCAFAGAVSLTIGFSRTERQLSLARQNERDLAERNRMLDSLNAMKSEFMANIAHEIRTPLTVISGFAQQTGNEIARGVLNEEAPGNLRLVSDEAQRLAVLADQMLYSTKNQQVGIELAPTAPEGILARAAALCAPILKRKGNRMAVHAQGCPPVMANADMIGQVLANLCLNANRHTKNDVIALNAEQTEPDYVTFTVRDHGSGIPPALLSRVFERGVSGDEESGLGLSICRDIIKSHGGSIHVQSEGGYTTVTFTLPIVHAEGDETE